MSVYLPRAAVLALKYYRSNDYRRSNITATGWEDGFATAGTISGYVMAGTVVLLVLWWVINHWGWWRLRVPGQRPQYIKTPLGWVEREKWDRKREKSRARRQARNQRGEENFDWLFWDPEGSKKYDFDKQRKKGFIKFLPSWLKIFDPWALGEGKKDFHSSHEGGDRNVERGDIVTKKPRKPRLGDRWISLSILKVEEPQQPDSQIKCEPGPEQNPPEPEGSAGCHGELSLYSGRDSTQMIGTNISDAASLPTPDDPTNKKLTIPKKVLQRSASLSLPRTIRADNARRRLAARSDPTNNIRVYYGFNPRY